MAAFTGWTNHYFSQRDHISQKGNMALFVPAFPGIVHLSREYNEASVYNRKPVCC